MSEEQYGKFLESLGPTYTSFGYAMAHYGIGGAYGQSYIVKGENEDELLERGMNAAQTNGSGSLASVKGYTDRIEVTTDDPVLMGKLAEMGIKEADSSRESQTMQKIIEAVREQKEESKLKDFMRGHIRIPEKAEELSRILDKALKGAITKPEGMWAREEYRTLEQRYEPWKKEGGIQTLEKRYEPWKDEGIQTLERNYTGPESLEYKEPTAPEKLHEKYELLAEQFSELMQKIGYSAEEVSKGIDGGKPFAKLYIRKPGSEERFNAIAIRHDNEFSGAPKKYTLTGVDDEAMRQQLQKMGIMSDVEAGEKLGEVAEKYNLAPEQFSELMQNLGYSADEASRGVEGGKPFAKLYIHKPGSEERFDAIAIRHDNAFTGSPDSYILTGVADQAMRDQLQKMGIQPMTEQQTADVSQQKMSGRG